MQYLVNLFAQGAMNKPINKLTLHAGRIESQRELHAEDIDAALLRRAQAMLLELRSGSLQSLPLPIPGASQTTVFLGPTPSESAERHIKEVWRSQNPNADLAEYETLSRGWAAQRQRGVFRLVLPQEERPRVYLVAPQDDFQNDPQGQSSLHGAISGLVIASSFGKRDYIPWEQESEVERAALLQEIGAVVEQIKALRPCFIAPPVPTVAEGVFGDHFAIAMLLSYSLSDEGDPV